MIKTDDILGTTVATVVRIPNSQGQYLQDLFNGSFNSVIKPSDIIAKGPVLDVRAFGSARTVATLMAAMNAIGTAKTTVRITPGTWEVDVGVSWHVNTAVEVMNGAVFNFTGNGAMIFNGPLIAGPYTIFTYSTSAAPVTLFNTTTPIVHEQWYGTGNAVDFKDFPIFPTVMPTTDYQGVHKKYVDSLIAGLGTGIPRNIINQSTYTVLASDAGKELACIVASTLTLEDASTYSSGFAFYVRNNSQGSVSINATSQNIYYLTAAGEPSISLGSGEAILLETNGTDWHVLSAIAAGAQYYHELTDPHGIWYAPAGVKRIFVLLIGGGGGGGRCPAVWGWPGGGPGGGGAAIFACIPIISGQTTFSYTIGAGGASILTDWTFFNPPSLKAECYDGVDGQSTSFGNLVAPGGQGGRYLGSPGDGGIYTGRSPYVLVKYDGWPGQDTSDWALLGENYYEIPRGQLIAVPVYAPPPDQQTGGDSTPYSHTAVTIANRGWTRNAYQYSGTIPSLRRGLGGQPAATGPDQYGRYLWNYARPLGGLAGLCLDNGTSLPYRGPGSGGDGGTHSDSIGQPGKAGTIIIMY